jgi:hypothetical protein
MPQKMDIAGGLAEPVGHRQGRQAIDKGSSQGLLAPLPVMDGMGEEGVIPHAILI